MDKQAPDTAEDAKAEALGEIMDNPPAGKAGRKNKAKKAKKDNKSKTPKPKLPMSGKKKFSLVVFCLGLLILAGGAAFLILNMLKKPDMRDAEYLVTVGTWTKENEPDVIWNFTEVGKGTLTTNNHLNDYEFIWAMDGETLKIETSWLYTLNNEYNFAIDQDGGSLTLTTDEETTVFVPADTTRSAEEP